MRQHRRRARTENWKESRRQEKAPTTINKRTRPVRFTVRFTRTCTRRQRRPAAQHSSNKWKLNRKMWQQQKKKQSNQKKRTPVQKSNQIKSIKKLMRMGQKKKGTALPTSTDPSRSRPLNDAHSPSLVRLKRRPQNSPCAR